MELKAASSFYKDFINNLVNNYDFSHFLCDRTKESLMDWINCWHPTALKSSQYELFIDWGVSKCVIGSKEIGYVIKIPFENKKYNYCAWEVENYDAAVSAGLAKYFAWCDELCSYFISGKVVPIYIMKYAESDEESFANYVISTYPEIARDWEVTHSVCDHCVEDVLREEWGNEAFNQVDDLTWEQGINDIHGGNVGLVDGRWVLIDYSGYCG